MFNRFHFYREVSLIWKPKNPYSNKKFPLLIGSSEWWADDSVGLKTVEDSLDVSKEISESESESESVQDVEKSVHVSYSLHIIYFSLHNQITKRIIFFFFF